MIPQAFRRGFAPEYVGFDRGDSGLENLKWIRSLGGRFWSRLKSHRGVHPDGKGKVPIPAVAIPAEGREVPLKGFGCVKGFRIVSAAGDAEDWCTNDFALTEAKREELEGCGVGRLRSIIGA